MDFETILKNNHQNFRYDFVFVCQIESVLSELGEMGIPYVIVEPDNIILNEFETEKRRQDGMLIKQQWIGRFVPIANSHIRDFDRWFFHIKEIYDERISLEFIDRHRQIAFFVLNRNQYLSDIIGDLYLKRKHFKL